MKRLGLIFLSLFSLIVKAQTDEELPPPPPTASINDYLIPMVVVGLVLAVLYLKRNELSKRVN